jgi:hypothetical protein
MEWNALKDLYLATNGSDWHWFEPYSEHGFPWNFDTSSKLSNPCSNGEPWQGVTCNATCSDSPCHVKALNLQEHNLQGKTDKRAKDFVNLLK